MTIGLSFYQCTRLYRRICEVGQASRAFPTVPLLSPDNFGVGNNPLDESQGLTARHRGRCKSLWAQDFVGQIIRRDDVLRCGLNAVARLLDDRPAIV